MDFWRTIAVLFRRWYITVPAFVATLGLASAASSVVPVQYQSVSVLVLTTPLSGGMETTQPNHPNPVYNPLLNFDQSLSLTASIVIQQLNSSDTALALGVVPGGTTGYEVNNGTSNPELLQSGPFLFVSAHAPSAEAAQDVTEKISAMAAEILDQRQTELDAPASTHIGIQVVVSPTVGMPLMGSPLRAAAAVGALAGLASLAAVYGFESLMTQRRRRRAERARAAEQDDPAEATEGDTRAGVSSSVIGGPARPSELDPPGSARLVYEIPSAAASHRVNGVSSLTTASGAVDVLESPTDTEGDAVVDRRRRRVRRRHGTTAHGERADRPARGEATEER